MSAQNMHSMASSYKIDEEIESECKETIKSATLLTVEKPHTLDQLNKEVANFSMSWSVEHSRSSKVLLLRTNQIFRIRQWGARFQISEWCFPNQLRHPDNKSFTLRGISQLTWNERKRKFHTTCATGQWRRRWSTVSPLEQHKQQRFTIAYPLRIRLSQVRILPQVAIQIKKETRGEALAAQMPFQGNNTPCSPCLSFNTW